MGFSHLFKDQHSTYLESQISELKASCATQLASLRSEYEKHIAELQSLGSDRLEDMENQLCDQRSMFNDRIAELKSSHASELNRVIDENRRLREENDRLQLYVIPRPKSGSPSRDEEEDSRTPPSPQVEQIPAGTPWQRILRREVELDAERYARKVMTPVTTSPESDAASN
jgi:hypothetical protein